ncbi:MAG: endonuclease domain-containing protein [Ruminococcaceae bacterium]|nr:endonuclease domain-containing protein [Oscillospiraceae bacterium]
MPYKSCNVARARKLRKEMTPWERKLWYCFLSKYPVRFQRQKMIDKYIVDFYCAAAKLAIELDGGGHYYKDAIKKDEQRTKIINQFGVEIVRFCNTDIDKHFYEVCSVIDQTVKGRYRRGTPPVKTP